jgi:hypothetical protein
MLPGVGVGVSHLDVVRHGDVRHGAARVGVANGQVHHRRNLRRVVDHLVVCRDVLVQLVHRDFLLVPGAEDRGLLRAGDGQHRHVVELGVVQAVQQVDPARPGGGQAHAELTGGLGVRGGHECGGLLVVDEDEPDLVLVPPQALHDPVDAVAGNPEHGIDAPFGQPPDQCLRNDLSHCA